MYEGLIRVLNKLIVMEINTLYIVSEGTFLRKVEETRLW